MPETTIPAEDSGQREVVAFLKDPASYAARPASVEVIETHGAFVFLAGDDVYKIKRAVSFGYMDFSTLERRRRACNRELEVNRPHAPAIYSGVVAITREPHGGLSIAGSGVPVEWAVHMRRFADGSLLSDVVADGRLDAAMVKALAQAIAAYHRSARPVRSGDGAGRLRSIIDELEQGLGAVSGAGSVPAMLAPRQVQDFVSGARSALTAARALLNQRHRDGYVRRAHGDLHLRNVVLIDGKPLLFDAIEFNDDIATVDTLYDLAFLLMDLDVSGHRDEANLLLNRYLYATGSMSDIDALAVLPLFLSLRAGIRAMVLAQRASQVAAVAAENGAAAVRSAQHYLAAALGYFDSSEPCLIAVGGLSGTGKSTLAAALAAHIGRAPGALHIRSDLERKALFKVGETTPLPPASYTRETAARVYEAVYAKAARVLGAGHCVIADGVFLRPEERASIEAVANAANARFIGLWLSAPLPVLIKRVMSRKGDASDATRDVITKQLAEDPGEIGWSMVDAGGDRAETLLAARQGMTRLWCS